MSWVVLIFNALMLIWLIAVIVAASHASCAHTVTLGSGGCHAATDVGAAIGASIIIALWVAGDVILGVIWLVTGRRSGRECPVCARKVKRGLTVCKSCGYDFAQLSVAPMRPAP